jgi:hypothetical protein
MTRLEKCEILKSKGYTYNPDTGKIFNIKNQEISNLSTRGYVIIEGNKDFNGTLNAHHYAYYCIYGNVDFEMLDHINRIKSDNRIVNLRISNTQKNAFNTNAKGYYFDKSTNRWRSIISIDGKKKHLGRFDTEEEAKEAYLIAKEKYHII